MVAARKRENQNRINDKIYLYLHTVKEILQYAEFQIYSRFCIDVYKQFSEVITKDFHN